MQELRQRFSSQLQETSWLRGVLPEDKMPD
jgi:hypothetical protein